MQITKAIVSRIAPHNIELEQALLGAIMINNDAFHRVSDFLDAHQFFEPIHEKIQQQIEKAEQGLFKLSAGSKAYFRLTLACSMACKVRGGVKSAQIGANKRGDPGGSGQGDCRPWPPPENQSPAHRPSCGALETDQPSGPINSTIKRGTRSRQPAGCSRSISQSARFVFWVPGHAGGAGG
jgi:hypothetical protein